MLFGVKKWDDPTVLNSLAVGDEQLASQDTPSGRDLAPVHVRRLRRDRRPAATGTSSRPPSARRAAALWPLLTGERGEYELIAGRGARPHLRTIANTANDGLMLPEQVWDGRAAARASAAGEGTRSATPLAWTHAQFVRLAWSIDAGEPVERPSIVACRYTGSVRLP